MKIATALAFAASLAACSPAAQQREKTTADYAAEADAFNQIAFACTTGTGDHDKPVPRARILQATLNEMPDPANAVADVLGSSCTKSSLDFAFCSVAAQRMSGGLVSGSNFFFGHYASGRAVITSRGAAAGKDCAAMARKDRGI